MGIMESIFGALGRPGFASPGGISKQQKSVAPNTPAMVAPPPRIQPSSWDDWPGGISEYDPGVNAGPAGGMGDNAPMPDGANIGDMAALLDGGGGDGGQGNQDWMFPQSQPWQTYTPPTMTGLESLWGNPLQDMASDMNDTIGAQLNQNANNNFRNNALDNDWQRWNADNNFRNNQLNSNNQFRQGLLGAILGLGGGGAGGAGGMGGGPGQLKGFQDTKSGQFGKLPGADAGNTASYGTTITAQAPSPSAIRGQANTMASMGGATPKMPNAVPMSAAQYGAGNSSFGNQLATKAGQSALNFQSGAIPQAAQLGLGIQGATANQGLGLASNAIGAHGNNVNSALNHQSALMQALTGLSRRV